MIFLMMTTFFLIQTGILYIMVLKLSQSSVTHTFFLVVSFVFIIQRLLSDKAITAPQTHESNANSADKVDIYYVNKVCTSCKLMAELSVIVHIGYYIKSGADP